MNMLALQLSALGPPTATSLVNHAESNETQLAFDMSACFNHLLPRKFVGVHLLQLLCMQALVASANNLLGP